MKWIERLSWEVAENHRKALWLWVSRWANWGCTPNKGNYIFQCAHGYSHWWEISEPWRGNRHIWSESSKTLWNLEHCSDPWQPDIDGTELPMKMYNFPTLPSKNMTNMDLLTFLHERKLAEIYPNMWVALRNSPCHSCCCWAFLSLNSLKLTRGLPWCKASYNTHKSGCLQWLVIWWCHRWLCWEKI